MTWLRSAAIMVLFASIVQLPAVTADAPSRVTTSFEVRHTDAVLKRVAKVFNGGFDHAAAEQLSKDIAAMASDAPRSWDYSTLYKGAKQPLKVKALVDDLGMVDLDFTCSAEVAAAVRAAIDGYLNSRNL